MRESESVCVRCSEFYKVCTTEMLFDGRPVVLKLAYPKCRGFLGQLVNLFTASSCTSLSNVKLVFELFLEWLKDIKCHGDRPGLFAGCVGPLHHMAFIWS
jgi:hypothetical protein